MSRSMLYSPWRACARMCALVSRRLFSVRACACRVLGTPVWGGCFERHACAGVCGGVVFVAFVRTFYVHVRCRVCACCEEYGLSKFMPYSSRMHSCMRSLFIQRWGTRVGDFS